MQNDYRWTKPLNGVSHLDHDLIKNRRPRFQYTYNQINDTFFECFIRPNSLAEDNKYQCEDLETAVKWLVEKYETIEG